MSRIFTPAKQGRRPAFVSNNTQNNFSAVTDSGGDDSLAALHGNSVFDANVLGFSFSVGAGMHSVSAQFLFGSEEFPTQQVPDVFGFFVDGVNYAVFANGDRISNNGDSSNFIANPVDGGRYGVEYNGLTKVYTVTGLLNSGLTSHTISIGIADTWDGSFDSGVFLSSLKASTASVGGIDNDVPEPAALSLLGLGLAGLAAMRRRA
ncbi:choice-of-anchor L domain-containing protein [Massilia sp. LjRoot122]|uniref:choice-of-anchor L domain-containing protein n=1 Tax=Massilia sp. LjRoot122 TaxID=3342257 RepID=UPI003ECFF1DE